jgi:hypothetical protein
LCCSIVLAIIALAGRVSQWRVVGINRGAYALGKSGCA